jgi:uncharacterized membrane protein
VREASARDIATAEKVVHLKTFQGSAPSQAQNAGEGAAAPAGKPRIPVIDVARGVALSAMIVYHFAWDLSFLGFIDTAVGRAPGWVAFARAIAGSFLFLVGIGLVLADDAGQSWGGFLRRLAKVGLAAAAITVATLIFMPDAFIFFGILHMIAVGSILALPFLRAPVPLTLIAAAFVLSLPHFVGWSAFDPLWLAWTGLYRMPPSTLDFEPVFPWFGPILLGVAAGRIIVDTRLRGLLADTPVRGRVSRGLQTMGRWSLVVYLIHQPILLGILYPIAMLRAPAPVTFVQACAASCEGTGADPALCARACSCVAESLEASGLRHILTAQSITPEEQALVDDVARQCFAAERPGAEGAPGRLD